MKKSIFVFAVSLFVFFSQATAQVKWNAGYQAYIDKYKDIAIREMLSYNIPASITLAQGLLESGAGRSDLTRKGNNHFGIKCHGWTGRTTYHDDDEQGECFRAYDSPLESFEDHSRFLATSKRYQNLFMLSHTDYKGWAHGLKKAGYATNPQYAHKLIEIIDVYKLHQYDKAKEYDKTSASATSQYTSSQPLHPIYLYNHNYYLRARKGDTFRSIGEETGISYRKIARANERDKNDVLKEGEIIYLKKKRSKADKQFRNHLHTVRSGESLYSISQIYGIRLKSLYRKNNFEKTHRIAVGDKIKVY